MKNKDFYKHLFSTLLFGTNGIIASFISLSSIEIVLFRTLIGSIMLTVLFLISGGKFTFYKVKKEFLFLAASGVAMGASWMFLYEAYSRVGVSIATLLYYCGPVIVMAISPLLFNERLTINTVLGFHAVVAGVLLINGNTNGGKLNTFGIIVDLLSALTYSFMVIFNKKAGSITGLENSTLQLIIAFFTVAIFVGFKQGFSIEISSSSILPILILGIVNTGFGCYLYFSTISKLKVQTVAILGYLELLSAVVLSSIFLKEILTPLQIIGALLIIGGAVIGELKQHNN